MKVIKEQVARDPEDWELVRLMIIGTEGGWTSWQLQCKVRSRTEVYSERELGDGRHKPRHRDGGN